jgi:hypothetical protein
MGVTINIEKSILVPTTRLVYLGLIIDTSRFLRPTTACIQHLMQLTSVVQQTSPMDLQRIMGYISWLAHAMGWPMFLATLILNRNTYWIRKFQVTRTLHQPRKLAPRLQSRQLHTDATPHAAAAVFVGPPKMAFTFPFLEPRAIAWAEMTAAIEGIIWCCQNCLDQPTNINLFTDSMIVFFNSCKRKGDNPRGIPSHSK